MTVYVEKNYERIYQYVTYGYLWMEELWMGFISLLFPLS